MSVELEFFMRFRVTETVVDDFTDTAQDTLRREIEELWELDSGTTPDIEDYALFLVTLSGGAASINLAALLHNHGGVNITKDATGKKIRAVMFMTPSANTGNITVAKGASNGYAPLGSTYSRIIAPDCVDGQKLKAAAADVASGARVWDVTGTGSEQVYVAVGWG